jgi:hypothetical protein
MSRRGGNPMLKYASMVLLSWSLVDMAMGISAKTGYPVVAVFGVFFAGYLFFKSRMVSGHWMDMMIFFVMLMLVAFPNLL